MGSSIIRIVVLLSALLSANAAHAICRGGQAPNKLYVGAGAVCDYSSIQLAINAAGDDASCGTIINVTPDTNWINQSLQISGNKKLTLVGWGSGETCSHLKNCTTTGCTFNQNPRLPIKPASGQSGLYVSGASNDISVNNIEFTGGSLGADHGGAGIAFAGSGSLSLDTVTIDNNTAGWGGGIDFSGSGSLNLTNDVFVDSNTASSTDGGGIWVSPSATTTVTLGNNIHVTNNTAQRSGGGIFVQGDSTPGDAYLSATSPNLWIYNNHAPKGNGGGLFVGANALADIGSSGLSNVFPTIEQNDAAYGGGIAVAAPNYGCGSTAVRLFTTDPNHAVSVSNNSASHTGGGIYVQPELGDCRNPAIVCAENFSIDNNSAQEGAAIYADDDGASPLDGGFVGLNVVTSPSFGNNNLSICQHSNLVAHGAVSCAAGVACNELNGNVAQTVSGTPTSGAAILMQTAGYMYADRFSMRGNTGGKAIRVLTDGDEGAAALHNCLLAENTATEQLIDATPGGGSLFNMAIDSCTIAENSIGADHSMIVQLDDSSTFALSNSIIAEPGLPTLDYQGNSGNLSVSYVLSTDVSTLSGIGVIKGGPNFILIGGIGNPGDYHLQPYSLGVDFAPAGSTSLDLDSRPRSVDLSDVPNVAGPMDLGAYEIQSDACSASDTIFCTGFEN